jgi:hypothetical protein
MKVAPSVNRLSAQARFRVQVWGEPSDRGEHTISGELAIFGRMVRRGYWLTCGFAHDIG